MSSHMQNIPNSMKFQVPQVSGINGPDPRYMIDTRATGGNMPGISPKIQQSNSSPNNFEVQNQRLQMNMSQNYYVSVGSNPNPNPNVHSSNNNRITPRGAGAENEGISAPVMQANKPSGVDYSLVSFGCISNYSLLPPPYRHGPAALTPSA